MPISRQELNRIVKLHGIIEGHKEHSHAAPTYKDSPYLAEMAQIALAPRDHDIETLEEIIPTLWYLTECYDKMCRAGMSVKFYTPQLQAHTELMKLREYDSEDMEGLENCFYLAVKARNYYEPDDCSDLVAIVSGSLPDERISELLLSAQESRRGFIKNDPVEKTEKYLAVIDKVEEKIEKTKQMDFCLEYWSLKARFLFEYGILWRSPSQLNPGVMFD